MGARGARGATTPHERGAGRRRWRRGAARPLRVAMVGQKGVPATFGGIEHHVEELGARLAERGVEVTVYCRRSYAAEVPAEHRGCASCHPDRREQAPRRHRPQHHLDRARRRGGRGRRPLPRARTRSGLPAGALPVALPRRADDPRARPRTRQVGGRGAARPLPRVLDERTRPRTRSSRSPVPWPSATGPTSGATRRTSPTGSPRPGPRADPLGRLASDLGLEPGRYVPLRRAHGAREASRPPRGGRAPPARRGADGPRRRLLVQRRLRGGPAPGRGRRRAGVCSPGYLYGRELAAVYANAAVYVQPSDVEACR